MSKMTEAEAVSRVFNRAETLFNSGGMERPPHELNLFLAENNLPMHKALWDYVARLEKESTEDIRAALVLAGS